MRLAFYAPLKPPDHPVPSGDRRMAQLLIAALTRSGHEVELAARLRSFDQRGDSDRQRHLATIGDKLAARLIARLRGHPLSQRPRLWMTYHLYYKAPDWIGPRVASQLAIPYVVVEASVAGKRAGGPWGTGHEAVLAALARADAVVSLNPADEAGVRSCLAAPERLHALKPFIDAGPYFAAARVRAANRLATARRFSLPAREPWLIAVAMMREGDKLASYRVLGGALDRIREQAWRLLVIGDGTARAAVERVLAPLGERVCFAGMLPPQDLPTVLGAADLFVWPAINEAYGMAILEAQAAGLPVVAGRSGGVSEIVADAGTGLLVPPGDEAAFAEAVRSLLADDERRATFAAAALRKVRVEHDITAAADALDYITRLCVDGRA